MKTKTEIILETIARLLEKGRCMNENGKCAYSDRKGNNCAVGACLIDPDAMQDWADEKDVWNSGVTQIENLHDKLKEEYRGHNLQFWVDLQVLHDRKINHETASDCIAYVLESFNLDLTNEIQNLFQPVNA